MKVFLDINVLLSGVATRGLCTDLLERLLEENVEIIISEQVVDELRRILVTKFKVDLEQLDFARELIARIPRAAVPQPLPFDPAIVPDPDDGTILAAALAAGAQLFVTGDRALLSLEAVQGMPIVSPRDCWGRLGSRA